MKPRIKKVGGYWRVVPGSLQLTEGAFDRYAKAQEWCRGANRDRLLKVKRSLLGLVGSRL